MSIKVDDTLLDSAGWIEELAADARVGLTSTPKSLPPRWFYDARGSELFEQITELPEYYPTRTEAQILRTHADDIAAAAPAPRRGHRRGRAGGDRDSVGLRVIDQDPVAARCLAAGRQVAPDSHGG